MVIVISMRLIMGNVVFKSICAHQFDNDTSLFYCIYFIVFVFYIAQACCVQQSKQSAVWV